MITVKHFVIWIISTSTKEDRFGVASLPASDVCDNVRDGARIECWDGVREGRVIEDCEGVRLVPTNDDWEEVRETGEVSSLFFEATELNLLVPDNDCLELK